MRATRNDNVDTTKGALCRAEMLEAIVRLSEKLGLFEFRTKPKEVEIPDTITEEASGSDEEAQEEEKKAQKDKEPKIQGKEIENLKTFFVDFVKPLSLESNLLNKRTLIQTST